LIVDSNALLAFVDGDTAVGDILRQQARACIPVIVLGEFRYGIAQSRHRAAYEQWLRSELDLFEVLAVTAQTTITYATLRVALREQGAPIPTTDAWIAALALQHKLPVLTRDRHFNSAPGMKRQGW
jgi:predicted nucleic acid-binding protein